MYCQLSSDQAKAQKLENKASPRIPSGLTNPRRVLHMGDEQKTKISITPFYKGLVIYDRDEADEYQQGEYLLLLEEKVHLVPGPIMTTLPPDFVPPQAELPQCTILRRSSDQSVAKSSSWSTVPLDDRSCFFYNQVTQMMYVVQRHNDDLRLEPFIGREGDLISDLEASEGEPTMYRSDGHGWWRDAAQRPTKYGWWDKPRKWCWVRDTHSATEDMEQ